MGLCVECGKDVPEEQLELSGQGHVCVDCRQAAAGKSKGLEAPVISAVVALVLSGCLNFSWSSSTTLNGVTDAHTIMLGPLIGGPIAAVLGLVAVIGPLRAGRRDLNVAIGAVVVVLGVGQLLRGLMAL